MEVREFAKADSYGNIYGNRDRVRKGTKELTSKYS